MNTKKKPRRAVRTMPNLDHATVAQGERLMHRTCVLDVRIRSISFQRKEQAADVVKEDVDAATRHVTKDLIDRKSLIELNRETSRFKTTLEFMAMPCSMMRKGMFVLPLDTETLDRVQALIDKFKTGRRAWFVDFTERYPGLKAAAKKKEGPRYRESDYPTLAEIEARVVEGVKTRYLSFNVPAALEQLNEELAREEREKAKREWAIASVEVRDALRQSFLSLIAHAKDRLTTERDGKKRVFRDTMPEKINLFLDTFASRNLTGDTQLAQLIEQARQVMSGIKPKDLRKDADVREQVRVEFAKIEKSLDRMVVTQRRAISFDDDV